MNLCRLNIKRAKSIFKASRRIAFAAALASFASTSIAQTSQTARISNDTAQSLPTYSASAGSPTSRLAPIVSASSVRSVDGSFGNGKASCANKVCGPNGCPTSGQTAGDQPTGDEPKLVTDRYGLPMPLAAAEITTLRPVRSRVSVAAANDGQPGHVGLAIAQGGISTIVTASGESLIDINVPIPGVPGTTPKLTRLQSEQATANDYARNRYAPPLPAMSQPEKSTIAGSISDQTSPELEKSSRRVAKMEDREPELITRGQPLRISVDPGSSQDAVSPVESAANSNIELKIDDSMPSLQAIESDVPAGESEQAVVLDSFSESSAETAVESNLDTVDPGALPVADMELGLPTNATVGTSSNSNEQYPEGDFGPMGQGSLKLSDSLGEPSLAFGDESETRFQLGDDPALLGNGIASTNMPLALSRENTAYGVDPITESDPDAPQPLTTEIDPSNLLVGDSMVVSRETPVMVQMERPVLEYSVEHPGICRLIQTSDNTLSLIGLREGDTRIAVVTAGGEEDRSIEIRGVRVATAAMPHGRLQTLALEVTQTVKRLYPYGDVQVVASGEQLIVQGYVQSEKEARKILQLVRKTSLKPVVDRLHSMSR